MAVKNWVGEVFGNLTVVSRSGLFEFPDNGSKCGRRSVTSVWKCRCVCGREIEVRTQMLKRGKATCGNPECCTYLKSKQTVFWEPVIEGATAKIPLGNRDKFALVDVEDVDKIRHRGWFCNAQGYASAKILGEHTLMHRLVMNAESGTELDHINHDKLDNRKENLRFVTRSQNLYNSKPRKSNTGIKGVHKIERETCSKYHAYIAFDNKQVSLGFYDTLEEAIAVRKAAEEKYHREFRYTGG
jgi:hypothetical protein